MKERPDCGKTSEEGYLLALPLAHLSRRSERWALTLSIDLSDNDYEEWEWFKSPDDYGSEEKKLSHENQEL